MFETIAHKYLTALLLHYSRFSAQLLKPLHELSLAYIWEKMARSSHLFGVNVETWCCTYRGLDDHFSAYNIEEHSCFSVGLGGFF